MWGNMGDWGWGWGMLGIVQMLLWWVLVILGIAVLAKWLFGGGPRRDERGADRALEILGERYARGEINKDEYEQKRRDIAG